MHKSKKIKLTVSHASAIDIYSARLSLFRIHNFRHGHPLLMDIRVHVCGERLSENKLGHGGVGKKGAYQITEIRISETCAVFSRHVKSHFHRYRFHDFHPRGFLTSWFSPSLQVAFPHASTQTS